MNNSRLVYSTEKGRLCPKCGKTGTTCNCKQKSRATQPTDHGDGIIRIRREVKGRRGKGVTTLSGFTLDPDDLKQLATMLKRLCGTGGSVKGGVILIQGDHRTTLQAELSKQGFRVKQAGG